MDFGIALLLIALLLAGATALGFVVRSRSARVASGCGADEHALAIEGAHVTLVQLSSPVCSACTVMRKVLGDLAATDPTLAHREIDVVDESELAQRHSVYSTPTTLVLDAEGLVRSRLIGAVRPDEVRRAIEAARQKLVTA
jgi:thioredoxin-related protein